MARFGQRVLGAMRLSAAAFEEVEHDPTATGQAALVVLLASAGTALGWAAGAGEVALIRSAVGALIGWGVSAVLIWQIGTRLWPGRNTEANFGQLLRACGFAQAPGILHVVAIMPVLGWFVSIVVIGIWVLVANVIAVRQALDYETTPPAIAVCALAWVVQGLMIAVFGGVRLF